MGAANIVLNSTQKQAGANNYIGWQFDSNCRNVRMGARGLHAASGAATIDIATPSGAAANAAGFSGPVVLDDPRSKTGTQLTVAGSHIVRVDATAAIVVRPVDAP